METKLECDICGIKFTQPFVKITQQLNCPACDFTLIWDGEETMRIAEKSLCIIIDGIQYFFCANLIDDELTIEIEQHPDPNIEGKIIAILPLPTFTYIKLDYEFCKEMIKTLTTTL